MLTVSALRELGWAVVGVHVERKQLLLLGKTSRAEVVVDGELFLLVNTLYVNATAPV